MFVAGYGEPHETTGPGTVLGHVICVLGLKVCVLGLDTYLGHGWAVLGQP